MILSPVGIFHTAAALSLLVLGFLAITAPKSRVSRHPTVGEAYFWVLAITLGSAIVVGAQDPAISIFELLTPPTFLLGLLGYVMAKRRPSNWLRWHIVGQGGSYIGVVTGFGLQTFPRLFPPSQLLTIASWFLPTLIGTILIRRAINKWIRPPRELTQPTVIGTRSDQ